MTLNFTLIDILSAILAFLLFIPILFIPGYTLGWFSNLFRFKRQHLIFQLTISIALSVSSLPVIYYYLILRFLPNHALWYCLIIIWAAFLILVYYRVGLDEFNNFLFNLKNNRILLWLIFILGIVLLLTMVDFSYNNRLYLSVMNYDYTTRTSVISAITRTGVPPVNPFFFPGVPIKLSYHYFWFIICSLVERMGAGTIGPRAASFGSTLWAGLALISVILLYQKVVKGQSSQNLKRISLISVGLLCVTGLDVVMVILYCLLILFFIPGRFPSLVLPTIEWWNEQITGWLDAILWVPHHIAALIACLMCLMIYQSINDYAPSFSRKLVYIIICGLCFSSALGLSVFVSLVFSISLFIWFIWSIISKDYKESFYLFLIGLFSLIISLPFLHEIASTAKDSASPISLAIRQFGPVAIGANLFRIYNTMLLNTINLFFLPLNYFIELGAYLAIAFLYWRGNQSFSQIDKRKQLLEITVFATSVIVSTFLRSNVTGGNDLGWRGFMFAQFILLIWAGDYLNSVYSRYNNIKIAYQNLGIVGPLIIIGILSTVYDLAILRSYTIFMDSRVMVNGQHFPLGKRNDAIRQAYGFINGALPKDAIIQHNPDAVINYGQYLLPFEFYNGLYGNRQVILSDKFQARGFAGSAGNLAEVTSSISAIFTPEMKDPHKVAAISTKFNIFAVIVKDTDRIWATKDSWVWRLKPCFENGYVKVFKLK